MTNNEPAWERNKESTEVERSISLSETLSDIDNFVKETNQEQEENENVDIDKEAEEPEYFKKETETSQGESEPENTRDENT